MKVVTHGEAQTMEFAKSLTPHFSAGTVVCLNGQPGAGKTDEDDLYSVGFFEDVNEKNCVFIEWSELADGVLETEPIRINIEYGSAPDERIITAEGNGL